MIYLIISDEKLPTDVHVASSIQNALEIIDQDAILSKTTENTFIVGGGQIYKDALEMPECRLVYLTLIQNEFPCDTFFSSVILDTAKFALQKPIDLYEMKSENDINYQYLVYNKIK
jgi:dihydrofolate reductase/thymidylate synthase